MSGPADYDRLYGLPPADPEPFHGARDSVFGAAEALVAITPVGAPLPPGRDLVVHCDPSPHPGDFAARVTGYWGSDGTFRVVSVEYQPRWPRRAVLAGVEERAALRGGDDGAAP